MAENGKYEKRNNDSLRAALFRFLFWELYFMIERTLLTRRAVANLFCVTVKTIQRWTKQGRLRGIYINPRLIRYDGDQVNHLIQEATVNA